MNVRGSINRDGRVVRFVGNVCDVALDHIIPHERNQYIPYLVRKWALAGIALLFIASKALLIIVPLVLPQVSVFSSSITVSNISTLVDAERKALGLPTLRNSPQLALAAQKKAQDMALNAYFAHKSPKGDTMRSFIGSTGYTYQTAGENLAMKFSEAEQVTSAWMLSPTHRANIISTKYSETGIGMAQGTVDNQPVTYVVQYFAKPQTTEKGVSQPDSTSTSQLAGFAFAPSSKELTLVVHDQHYEAVRLITPSVKTSLQKVSSTWLGTVSSSAILAQQVPVVLGVQEDGQEEQIETPPIQPGRIDEVFTPVASKQKAIRFLGGTLSLQVLNDIAQTFYIVVLTMLVAILGIIAITRATSLKGTLLTQLYSVLFIGIIVFIL